MMGAESPPGPPILGRRTDGTGGAFAKPPGVTNVSLPSAWGPGAQRTTAPYLHTKEDR